MYLLALDESGTHAQSPVFIVAGVAVHENDIYYLQKALDDVLLANLTPLGLPHLKYELHATEIKSPLRKTGRRGGRKGASAPPKSIWAGVPQTVRNKILEDVYAVLSSYKPVDPNFPLVFFGAAVDSMYRDRYRRAYDLVLNKFDEMLGRHYHERGERQRGVIIHDEHQIERELQAWTKDWREAGSTIGRLNNVVHVPLFTDSKSSQLLQAADFVAFSVWRHYGVSDSAWLTSLLPTFDQSERKLHGLIHVWPGYGKTACQCPPCAERAQRD